MTSVYEPVKPSKPTQLKTQVDKGVMNIPASWYIAMHSEDLGKKPMAIELFGRSLVAWRDQDNHPVIMNPFCSHMGASLAIGKVVDGCIQCPFHHWRYNSSGQCTSIPEVERIPPKARQVTYVTAEKYGYIWVWYGSVTPLFSLPKFSAAGKEKRNYMPVLFTYKTKTMLRRLIENSCDYYHIESLHGQKVSGPIQYTLLTDQNTPQQSELHIQKEAWFGALTEIPIARQVARLGLVGQALGLNAQTFTMLLDCWSTGGVITVFLDAQERFKAHFCFTPVNENTTIAHFLFTIRKTGKLWLNVLYFLIFRWQFKIATAEDMQILNNLNADEAEVHVKYDVGILKFRQFYQRWVDKVDYVAKNWDLPW